ncbi:hypothetical protein PHYPO_G00017260 [Pangasianodon hypophthalmus]|uniref:Uncharacterized protein n=1 Tax=Pangasianodon hypophthalmus TaxID=310915 RepID=A0A5N5N4T9_PANHP|nr:hypothetical protein PHYPO_G00017260 [Pangasianodon hypophthalmus]
MGKIVREILNGALYPAGGARAQFVSRCIGTHLSLKRQLGNAQTNGVFITQRTHQLILPNCAETCGYSDGLCEMKRSQGTVSVRICAEECTSL